MPSVYNHNESNHLARIKLMIRETVEFTCFAFTSLLIDRIGDFSKKKVN